MASNTQKNTKSEIAILPFDKSYNWIFKNAKPAVLSENDLDLIEQILSDCLNKHNREQKVEFEKLLEQNANNSFKVEDFLIDLRNYKRQYIAVINDYGEKEAWINCFCDPFDSDWKKEIVFVLDGGNCYFNLKVNLDKVKYYQFIINGEA